MSPVPPRLYVQVATRAPVALVFRKGAGGWWLLSRWDLATDELDHGAWFHGTLYPRRCDLSPDGKLLSYFAMKGNARGFLGSKGPAAFSGISKVPWLFALAAWNEGSTWTRGQHFVDERVEMARPDLGDISPMRYGLVPTRPEQYAAERQRGWVEHENCPPRGEKDMWDERRAVVLTKTHPKGRHRLVLTDQGWAANAPDRIEGRRPRYHLESSRGIVELPEAMWADWDQVGRLLIATETGLLQIRDGDHPTKVLREYDLNPLRPHPARAPEWAQRW